MHDGLFFTVLYLVKSMYSLFHYEQSHIQNFSLLKHLESGICSFVSCLSHSPFLTQISDIHEPGICFGGYSTRGLRCAVVTSM